MKPQKQTIFSDEKNDIHGNCFTACIASLFDMNIEDVPYFASYKREWFEVFWNFLKSTDYEYNGTIIIKNHIDWFNDYKGIDGFTIVGGTSPRGIKNGHAVIYKDGEPYFDPHPDNTFLEEAEFVYLIDKK
jgi:hypothetical protein